MVYLRLRNGDIDKKKQPKTVLLGAVTSDNGEWTCVKLDSDIVVTELNEQISKSCAMKIGPICVSGSGKVTSSELVITPQSEKAYSLRSLYIED